MESIFRLKEHGTTVKTEVLAGITTFMTMAYILSVNPFMLSLRGTGAEHLGMDFGAVFTATALSAIVACLVMAFYANLPFALAPGMGLNAFFAYTVVLLMGNSWQFALTAVFLEGLIFIVLTIFNVREAIISCIPANVKKAISVGIGLFIATIGLSNAGIIKAGQGTILDLGNIKSTAALLALFGILFTGVLLYKNIKGALLIGMAVTTLLGIPLGVTPMPENILALPPSIKPIMFQFQWNEIFTVKMAYVLFVFLFVDMFDTVGTLIGVSTKANMLDEKGNLPNVSKALMADAIGTTVGACLGTSTVTTYVESASGVAEGGRTGLTTLTTAFMFGLALFFAPLFAIIPAAATAPALVLVGLFMMSPIKEIDFDDFTEAIPAFLTIVMMPLSYSIANGIAFGMIAYIILKVLGGKGKEVSPVTYIVGLMFIAKFIV